MSADVTIQICVACEGGAALREAVAERLEPGMLVVGVECLAVCDRPASVALAATGKWTYLLGDARPDQADELIAAARAVAASETGAPPMAERPPLFRDGVIGRIAPFGG